MDLFNILASLSTQFIFYVALAAWLALLAIQWRKKRWLTFWVFVVAIVLTILWFERLTSEQSDKITATVLELLKTIISWPIVVLILLLAFRSQIGELFREGAELLRRSEKTEVAIGDVVKVTFETAKPVGVVSAPDGKPTETEIEKLIDTKTPSIPIQLPSGVADIFVQQPNTVGGAKINSNSGFVFNRIGHVVTFGRDLRDGQKVYVRLAHVNRTLPGVVKARSKNKLLAVVELPEGEEYTPLDLPQLGYPEFGELVYKFNIQTGVASGRVIVVEGSLSFPLGDQHIEQSGVIIVEPRLTWSTGEGGSPVLNGKGQVIGVVIASSKEPSQSLLVSTSRILEEFTILA